MARSKSVRGVAATCVEHLKSLAARTLRILSDALQETAREINQFNTFEPLESRQLLSSVSFSNGLLSLYADNGHPNTITVARSGSNAIANVDGKTMTVSTSQIRKIFIQGGDHADNVWCDINFTCPEEIRTYGGNDTIAASNGNDTINSGDGNDTVYSYGGNDLVNGTAGDDYLDGGAGYDTVWGETGYNRIFNAEVTESANRSTSTSSSGAVPQSTTTTTTTTTTSGKPTVTSLTLYNADTDKPIQTLTNGAVIDFSAIGTSHLTLVANTTGARSVAFGLDNNGGMYNDSSAPFAFAGDNNGNFNAWNPPSNGTHTALATPFSSLYASGTAGSMYKVSFTIKNSGGSITPQSSSPAPAPTPTSTNTAGGPNVRISVLDNWIAAGHAVFVNGLSSSLNAGSPISAKYDWDFGDYNSKYNNLTGWNASHIYNNPGTYTIRLTITNANRAVGTATTTVTVGADNRRQIYVSSSAGSDWNNGSYGHPIQSIAKLKQMLGNNTDVFFKSGDTFYTDSAISVQTMQNVDISSYGSGNKPRLVYNGGLRLGSALFYTGVGSDEITINNLTMDSIYTSTSTYEGMPFGVAVGGRNTVVSNCQFLNVADGVNENQAPQGSMVVDSSAPNGVRGYFAWVQGQDQVFIGNYSADSTYQHNLRNEGGDRILIAYNTFSNSDNSGGINKGCLTIHKGSYNYIVGNTLNNGKLSIGPLGGGDGVGDMGARMQYVVAENNKVTGMTLIEHGAEHVMLRNNMLYRDNTTAIDVEAFNTQYNRGVVDLNIVNNTAVNNSSTGNFLRVEGPVNGISLVNNLYLAPHLFTGANGTAPVFVLQNDLSSFRIIRNNVWPDPTKAVYAEGGINYVWSYWSDSRGYKTPSEWDAYGNVQNETFENPGYSGTYAPNWGTRASTAATPWAGVFTDMNGKTRSGSGSWTAGAIQD